MIFHSIFHFKNYQKILNNKNLNKKTKMATNDKKTKMATIDTKSSLKLGKTSSEQSSSEQFSKPQAKPSNTQKVESFENLVSHLNDAQRLTSASGILPLKKEADGPKLQSMRNGHDSILHHQVPAVWRSYSIGTSSRQPSLSTLSWTMTTSQSQSKRRKWMSKTFAYHLLTSPTPANKLTGMP